MDVAENPSGFMIFLPAASSFTLSLAPGLQTSTFIYLSVVSFQFWSVRLNSITVSLKQLWWQRPSHLLLMAQEDTDVTNVTGSSR